MTELEVKVNDIEKRQFAFEARFDEYIKSMDDFKTEMRDFKAEMRDRDNQRHAEIMALQQKTDAKFEQLGNKIDGIGKFVQNLTVAAMVGIGAVVIGSAAIVVAVIMK